MAQQSKRDPGAESTTAAQGLAPTGTRVRTDWQLAPGSMVDAKYRVIEPIGAGGMGQVYEVEHVANGGRRAMKLMHAQLALDAQYRKRFESEAKACARIGHPNVVKIFDSGEDRGRPYLVMEYLEGETLRQRLDRQGQLSLEDALQLMSAVFAGVYACHRAKIIHRDLKPDNILIARRECGLHDMEWVPIVLDLGIAKLEQAQAHDLETKTGVQAGTPQYMPPEQVNAKDVDPRADQFSLGLILHECLTGERPEERSLYWSGPALPATPGIPAELTNAISRMTQYAAGSRFDSLEDAWAALKPPAPTPEEEARPEAPRRRAVSGQRVALGAVLALGLIMMVMVVRALWPATAGEGATPPVPERQPAPQPAPRPPPQPVEPPSIHVTLTVDPPQARVALDGKPIVDRDLDLAPGSAHRLVAEAAGYQRIEREFVADKDHQKIDLRLQPKVRRPVSTAATPPAPEAIPAPASPPTPRVSPAVENLVRGAKPHDLP